MALIKCDECGREISSKSLFCPGCGYPTHLNSALGDNLPEPEAVKQIREQMAPVEPQQPVQPQEQPQQSEPQQSPEPEQELPLESEQEKPQNPSRRNERIKVWLFLGVFLVLLGVVLYFYFTAPMEYESVPEEIEAVEDAASDSIAAEIPADTVTSAAVPAPAVAAPVAAPAAPKAAPQPRPARESSDEVREIKVAPLSEQVGRRAPENETPDTE